MKSKTRPLVLPNKLDARSPSKHAKLNFLSPVNAKNKKSFFSETNVMKTEVRVNFDVSKECSKLTPSEIIHERWL